MATVTVLFAASLVVRWIQLAMSWVEGRAHSELLRAVARAKHDHRLRGLEAGPGNPGQAALRQRACPAGVETLPDAASPPLLAGTDATPNSMSVSASPAPAGAGSAIPRPPACARRFQPSPGVADHPTATPTRSPLGPLSPAGAGRVVPHTIPAPAGPTRVRVMIHG